MAKKNVKPNFFNTISSYLRAEGVDKVLLEMKFRGFFKNCHKTKDTRV